MPKSRRHALRSLEAREVALVRALLARPDLLDRQAEIGLRWALGLSRLYRVRSRHEEIDVEPLVLPLREETLRLLDLAGLREHEGKLAPGRLRSVAAILRSQALRARAALHRALASTLDPEAIDREVTHRALVLSLGGGGGTGYAYLGAFRLLEEHRLRPALIAGTSMGAVLGLFRARRLGFDPGEVLAVVRSLAIGQVFQILSTESRYGIPAALRLYLRTALGRFFRGPGQAPLRLDQLPIPLVTCVCGIRAGALPRPLRFYERLFAGLRGPGLATRLARRLPALAAALGELFQRADHFEEVRLGLDPGTASFDAIDAAGFSCALPGAIHYDVVRDDARMRGLLDSLFERRLLFRLADGGLVENVPARAAWQAVHSGALGTRNAFILALDAFAPRLSAPLWLPLQSLVVAQVRESRRWAHAYKPIRDTLSALELVPSLRSAMRMLHSGREELASELPLIKRMLEPLPALRAARGATAAG